MAALLLSLLGPPAPASGQLMNFVDWLYDGYGGPQLDAPFAVALSPDGANVYVAAYSVGALTVFRRDPSTGTLTLVEHQFDGLGGVHGLGGMQSITVTPDGAHVYVTSVLDDAVAVFQRDLGTGALTFVESTFVGVGGDEPLAGARYLAISPDGRDLYVASRRRLVQYHRNRTSGTLTYAGIESDWFESLAGGVSALAMSPDGANLYVTAYADNKLAVFRRDQQTGELQLVDEEVEGEGNVTGLAESQDVRVSPDGAHVYVASGEGFGAIAVFDRTAETGALSFVAAGSFGAAARALLGAWSLAISPSGDHVYVVGIDPVSVFRRDAKSGRLTFIEAEAGAVSDDESFVRLRRLAVSADGRHVYVVGELSVAEPVDSEAGPDGVAVFVRDSDTGELGLVETVLDDEGGIGDIGRIVSSILVSADGAYVYANGLTFRRDVRTGALSRLPGQSAGALAISPDGANLYGAGLRRSSSNPFFGIPQLVVLARDTATGQTTVVSTLENGIDGVRGIAAIASITVSPDSRHVYVLSVSTGGGRFPRILGGLATFRRDVTTGNLQFVEVHPNVMGFAAAISPDGAHLYVATADAIRVFSRDSSSGRLSFLFAHDNDDVAPNGELEEVWSMAVSSDGAHVYAAATSDSRGSDAVTIFRRESATGKLNLVDTVQNPADFGVVLTISPDGRYLFTGSYAEDAIPRPDLRSLSSLRAYERNWVTGALRFLEMQTEGEGVRGMRDLRALAISPDGAHLYAGGVGIAIFQIDGAGTCPGDCNRDAMVSIGELVTGTTIALEKVPSSVCTAFDPNGDWAVSIDEMVRAVRAALNSCTN